MTGADIRDIIQAVAVLVAAIGAVISAVRSTQAKSKADEVDTKVTTLGVEAHTTAAIADTKLDAVHQLTNSNLSQVKTDLEIANQRIEKLNTLVAGFAAERASGPPATEAIIVPVPPETPEPGGGKS